MPFEAVDIQEETSSILDQTNRSSIVNESRVNKRRGAEPEDECNYEGPTERINR